MSSWGVAIVGGTIATVLGGVILFYVIPVLQAPSSMEKKAPTANVTLKCPEGYGPGYTPAALVNDVPDICIRHPDGHIVKPN